MQDRIHLIPAIAPIHVSWNPAELELVVTGTVHVEGEQLQMGLHLAGDAAIQALRAFQTLLERVDIDAAAATKPRGLQ